MGHAAGCALAGKMLLEDGTIIIFLLAERRVYRETFGSMCHLLVGHGFRGDLLQSVYPRISHTVAELLLLSPCHLFGQHILECLARCASP